jgi:hypothetical protein
MVVQDSSYI